MSGVTDSALLDLIATTQENLPWDGKFALLQKYQSYEVCDRWLRDDKVKLQSGTSITRNVQYGESGAAKFVLPYASESPSVSDVQTTLNVRWSRAQTDYSIERSEMLMNRKKAKLIELIKSRRVDALQAMADLLEQRAWLPPSSTSNATQPYGVPYWITPVTGAQVTTASTDKFRGQNPIAVDTSAFSTCGGIDASSATFERWRNYNDFWNTTYGASDPTDLERMREMYHKLHFKAPKVNTQVPQPEFNLSYYTNITTLLSFERLAESRNDQLGMDVGKSAGQTVFRGVPIVWAPPLDSDSTYPLYAINHSYFKAYCLADQYFRETEPIRDRQQHNVYTTFLDLQFNFLVTDRQKCGGMISVVSAA